MMVETSRHEDMIIEVDSSERIRDLGSQEWIWKIFHGCHLFIQR